MNPLRVGKLQGIRAPNRFTGRDWIRLIGLAVGFSALAPSVASASFTANIAASPNPNGGDYTITWSNPAGLEYDLQQSFNSGSWTIVATTTSTSKSFVDKPAGNYSYRLRYSEIRCTGFPEPTCHPYQDYSEATSVTVVAPPAIPTGLTAPTNDYNGAYTVSWNGSSGATSYKLREKLGSGTWAQIYSGSGLSKAVSGRAAGTWYYQVMACKSGTICSNWSSSRTVTVVAKPATPTGLTAPATDYNGAFAVSWNTSARSTSYQLQEDSSSISWRTVYSGSGTSKSLSGRSPGTWYYRVRGCNVESVCSSWSSTKTVNVVAPPDVPVLSGPSTSENGDYAISWNQPARATSFQLDEQIDGGSWSRVYTGAGTSKGWSGRSPGSYSYRVRGCNVESICSSWSTIHTVEVPEPPPPVTKFLPTDAADFPDAAIFNPFVPTGDVGANSVGAVEGSGSVSGGSASYQIPIRIPPGRKGMQPNVSLSYSSSSGNGIVGVGWSLNAGSSITRCPATPAQDGFTAGVQYDALRDRLCLDGRRLVVVNGAYGQSGAEYRTELDIFARIRQYGALNGSTTNFIVEFKDGRISKYGSTADSRHAAAGRSEILTWAISETQDHSGNTITYDYQNFGDGEHLLSAIHYTGVNGSDGDRHVRFYYESRGDYRTSWLAGGKSSRTQRLHTVRTEYQARLVRKYTLNYGAKSASTGRSLLRGIEECAYLNGTEAHCLPPTTFDWQERATQYVAEPLQFEDPEGLSNSGCGAGTENREVVLCGKRWLHEVMPHGDANSDGVKDWPGLHVNAEGVITETRTESFSNCFRKPNSLALTCIEGDFNVDGRTDGFRRNNNTFEIRFEGTTNWINTGLPWNTSGASATADTPLAFADFNGDGWVDIAFKQSSKIWVYFHTQNPNAPYSVNQRQWIIDYPFSASGTSHTIDVQVYGDMDGNGTPDFVVSNIDDGYATPGLPTPQYIILTKANFGGTMTTSTRSVPWIAGPMHNANFFHDVNGDGLPDLLAIHPDYHNLAYRLNLGTGFASTWVDLGIDLPTRVGMYTLTGGEPQPYVYPVMSKVLVMDYDGDGVDEILFADTVLASGCSLVMDLDGDTWKCDDDLYETYQANPYSNIEAPINGAVKDNSVRHYRAHKFVQNASGTITATTFDTDIEASASQTAVVDATGDGLVDVVTVLGCRLEACKFNTETSGVVNSKYVAGAWINRNLGAAQPNNPDNRYEGFDLMNAVEDGLGVRNEWVYRPLSSDEYGKLNGAGDYYKTELWYEEDDPDYFHFASSMYVVAEHQVTNGVGGLNSTKYRYRGAIYNNKGRGFQGFKSIIVEEDVFDKSDPQAGVDKITRTDFHQKWPLSSIVEQACTWIATDPVVDDNPSCANVLSHTVTEGIRNVSTAGAARFVAIEEQSTTTYGLNSGALVATDSFDRSFDGWGNVTSETRSHDDAYGTTTTTTTQNFAPDQSAWWLDKLNSRTVTHNPVTGRVAPGIASGTDLVKKVTTTFTSYDTAKRLPTSITVTGNDTALSKTVTTTYNDRGLPTLVSTTGTGVTGPRTVETTYTDNGTTESANGYFPLTVTNALGHETRSETDPAHGQLTRIVDPNGLVSTTAYDAFGRPSEVTPAGQPTQSLRYFWCDTSCPPDAVFWLGTYAAGAPETRRYVDVLGREVQSSVRNFADSGFINVRTTYDRRGHKTFESHPYDPAAGDSGLLGTRYLSYDALGRLQSKEQDQANGTIFLTSYIYWGLKTSINAGGLMMHRIYNGLGQLVETKDAMGGYTRYAYDGAGNPIVLQDPNGNSIVAKFDAFGNKVWVDDPNMGEKAFTYSALGEVLIEQDINCSTSIGCDTTETDYDVLGRTIERQANGAIVGRWFYDNSASDKGLGLLDYEDSYPNGDGYRLRKYYYYSSAATNRKVLTRTLHRFYEGSATTDYETRYYTDSYYGRPKGIRYPGGVGVAYVYNAGGYLVQEKDASSSYVIREVTARDARNQVREATLADGSLSYTADYYPATGQMESITVTGASGVLHALDYTYDGFGNLHTQSKVYAGSISSETFWYDDLHRLMESDRSWPGGSQTINYDYDPAGNLTLKDDYATELRYEDPRPNAVSSITTVGGGTATFTYDANGNRLSGDGKTLTYTAFNRPATITAGGVTTSFAYGADLARYRQDKSTGETILYIDKLMEIVQNGGSAEYRHYLGDFAILTKTGSLDDPYPAVHFLHRDRLGSVVTITDENSEAEARGYDPFGKPREPDGAKKTPPVLGSAITDRGFTDHEHLDASQLIHMNGRVYDYNLGRFLSVDPLIQAPGHSQSLNPYSYIMNNPLAGVDPSGYLAVTGSRIDNDDQIVDGMATGGGQPVMVYGHISNDNGAKNSGTAQRAAVGVSGAGNAHDQLESQQGNKASYTPPEGIPELLVQGKRPEEDWIQQRMQRPDFSPAFSQYSAERNALLQQRQHFQQMLANPLVDPNFVQGINGLINGIDSQIADLDHDFSCEQFDCGIEAIPWELYLIGGRGAEVLSRIIAARGATKAVPLILQNKAAGDAFRDALAADLRKAGREVATEVYKRTPFGKRFMDIEISQDGTVLGGIETKVGTSRYTPLQRLKDWWLTNIEGYPVNVARSP
jgi:RHS repeat-associated protein